MHNLKIYKYLCGLCIAFFLAGCGSGSGSGGGGGNDVPTGSNGISQGVAVDPYIVGAVFQELASDGTVLQRQSTPSDQSGVFTFPKPLTEGSIVEMKISNKGLHGGAPYHGMLRRNIDSGAGSSVNVTPLTTMLANGSTEEDLLLSLNDAGFSGLTAEDLYANPMSDRSGTPDSDLLEMTGIDDASLLLLQANMAVNDYMVITGNSRATTNDLNNYEQREILHSVSGALKDRLSAAEFARIKTELGQDPQLSGQPRLGELIMAVVEQQRALVELVKEDIAANGSFDSTLVSRTVQDGMTQVAEMVKTQMPDYQPAPSPVDGPTLYANNCAMCHGNLANSSKKGRTSLQIQAAIDGNTGNMGFLSSLTTEEVQAIANVLPSVTPADPNVPADGAALYSADCAGCHGVLANTTKKGRTAADIQAAIDGNVGNMGFLSSLTAEEVQAIADVLPQAPAPTPSPEPTTPPDGVALYNSECAGCHQPLANTTKAGRTTIQIQAAIDGNVGNMGFLSSLTAEEVQVIADVLPPAPTPAPTPEPTTPPDGAALYSADCAGCHGNLNNTTKPGRTAGQIQAAIDGNVGNMGFLSSLTAEEVQAIADVLPPAPAPTPTPEPTTPPDGAALYSADCAGCHGNLNNTTKPGRTAGQIQAAIDGNVGNMGFLSSLTAEEVQAIADVLPPATNPGPDYSDCTACHGQPPSGNSYPDTAGAHTVHKNLPSVANNCGICHAGASHNGQLDFGFPASYNTKSGTATNNGNGTCSSVSCHGGQTTPNWESGSIAVNTQCSSCHSSGTGQYNGYYSGRHSKHLSKGYSCTVCHNTSKLATGHFSNLATTSFELSAANTIGGGSTSVGLYQGGTCSSINCHGSKSW